MWLSIRPQVRSLARELSRTKAAERHGLVVEDLEQIGLLRSWREWDKDPLLPGAYLFVAARHAMMRATYGQGMKPPPELASLNHVADKADHRLSVDQLEARMTLVWLTQAAEREDNAQPKRGRPPTGRNEARRALFADMLSGMATCPEHVTQRLARDRRCSSEAVRQQIAHILAQYRTVAR